MSSFDILECNKIRKVLFTRNYRDPTQAVQTKSTLMQSLGTTKILLISYINCTVPGNTHTHPTEGHWKLLGSGVSKANICKGKYGA